MVQWEEYRAVPVGYADSRSCQLFREFERRLSPTMRQQHVAGHKAFVDYSGKRVPIADAATGEVSLAEIFVAVLGASSLTYAEATWTQTLPDWIGAHVRMFRFFGAAPRLLVPDNLKSGVNKASFHDPEVNRSWRYAEWAPERLQRQARDIGPNTEALIMPCWPAGRTPNKASAPAWACCACSA
jgi:transposase